jgi:hypothetical protein
MPLTEERLRAITDITITGSYLMTPDQEIRAAITKLRGLAAAAGGTTWTADHYPEGTVVHPAGSTLSLFRLAADGPRAAGTPHVAKPVGAYIAAMNPKVGEALTVLLEAVLSSNQNGAPAHEQCESWCSPETCDLSAALAVARAINTGGRP